MIGEKIIKFEGDPEGEQIGYAGIINDITKRAINIDKYRLKSIFGKDFKIPNYQRGYEWDEEQWDEFWEEVEPLFDADPSENRKVSDVFFGSMFFSRRGTNDDDPRDNFLKLSMVNSVSPPSRFSF